MSRKVKPTVNTSEALRRRDKAVAIDSVMTSDEDLLLRIERGKHPRITDKTLGILATQGEIIATIDNTTKALEVDRKTAEDVIIDLAIAHGGLRGLHSTLGNFALEINPKRSIDDYSPSALRRAMGPNYSTAVQEEIQVNIFPIPLGRETPNDGPLTSEMLKGFFTNGLASFGFTPEEIKAFVHTDLILNIYEGTVGQLITDGKVKISDRVASVSERLEVTSRPLSQPEEAPEED